MSKINKFSKAFTLVEITVAVLIIVILAAIAIPLYLTHLEQARGSEALENLSLIRSAEMLYAPEHDGFTSNTVTLQKYVKFSLNDGNWVYTVQSSGPENFLAVATRTSPNLDWDGKTITMDQNSAIIIDGTAMSSGGSWPP